MARFTEIDTSLPWFDTQKFVIAEEAEVRRITIPPALKPNYTGFDFTFSLKDHVFIFEQYSLGKTLSPTQVLKFLRVLFSSRRLVREFGDVMTDVVSDAEQLPALLDMHQLRWLKIVVQRPNPDDLGELEKEIEERLRRQKARSMEIAYAAERDEGIRPNKETRQLAEIAMSCCRFR